jgi:hypothetical protein
VTAQLIKRSAHSHLRRGVRATDPDDVPAACGPEVVLWAYPFKVAARRKGRQLLRGRQPLQSSGRIRFGLTPSVTRRERV